VLEVWATNGSWRSSALATIAKAFQQRAGPLGVPWHQRGYPLGNVPRLEQPHLQDVLVHFKVEASRARATRLLVLQPRAQG